MSRTRFRGLWSPALLGSALALLAAGSRAAAQCVGDCNGNNMVTIAELILGVNIAQGLRPIADCPAFDCDNTGSVGINCLVQGVNNALEGCSEACDLQAGTYTITQIEGGLLTVSTLTPVQFPAGGTIVEDISAGTKPDCLHNVVVPYPDGFRAPVFCIPVFGFSVSLTQAGCGIGQIDSNGGSDYTITEIGDTSSMPDCNNQQACNVGVDSKVRVDITVGDDTPDNCVGGTANEILTVPVRTISWIEGGPNPTCPASDGMYNPDNGDQLILDVNQVLDFTTDLNQAKWMDLSGDGCAIAGNGPESGLQNTGVCWDRTANTIGLAASGTIGSKSSPLFDITFTTKLFNTVTGPDAPSGATCANPPLLPPNFNGTAVRCLE